jgi:glycerol-3-phosphate cytidylyltransferase
MLATQTDKIWKRGYVSGAFDMFHIGHLNLIKRAKSRCEYLVAGVLTDEIILNAKGKYPVTPLNERMEIIRSLKYVDEVDITTAALLNKITAWEKYRFDAMFSGDDHKDDGWSKEEDELKSLGADLVFFPYTKEVSTTFLQELTLPPKAEGANMALKISSFSYLFPFDKVKHGERVVIYGMGRVGREFAAQVSALNYCTVVAFTDTSKTEESFFGFNCITPDNLTANPASFNRIVIASTKYHGEILLKLRSLGIAPERIV